MSEIPKAPIARIIKDTGAERVSEDAKAELAEYLEEVARDVAIEANNVAKSLNVKLSNQKILN